MTATNELLDAVRTAANIPSDNVLSQKLGITRAVVSAWRKELYPVPDERIAQLCTMAKLDGPTWAARIHAERAQSPVERAMWKSMLDRLSAVAAVIALVCVSVPGIAKAKPVDIQGFARSDIAYSVYYVSPKLCS
ncbi:DUF3693 domain-containing protein [Stenotrophomonas rhizophila]|uniref:DUF3693 domain-containing protein n=1 Tax=Stenotrophomonas rhizophila TaxID=216778 RepID=UPI00081CA698|nr:DUF3693 domain-containing protein [Stenotrophomonas rhizophila]AOA72384.1 hypothetical protein BAY15_1950 [Stenotrophomonas rhizophila]